MDTSTGTSTGRGTETDTEAILVTRWEDSERQEELGWDRFLIQISYLDHHIT